MSVLNKTKLTEGPKVIPHESKALEGVILIQRMPGEVFLEYEEAAEKLENPSDLRTSALFLLFSIVDESGQIIMGVDDLNDFIRTVPITEIMEMFNKAAELNGLSDEVVEKK